MNMKQLTFEETSTILSVMTTQQRGLIGKMCKSPERFKPNDEKDKQLIDFINEFQKDLSYSEKIYLLANKKEEPEYCSCGNVCVFNTSTYQYGKFCSIECRNKQRKESPNCAKKFKIDDVIYSRIDEAAADLIISRHVLLSRCISNKYPEYQFYPDHQEGLDKIKNQLMKKDVRLVDENFLTEAKQNRITITELCDICNVDSNDIRNAMMLFDIETNFEQLPESVTNILNDKDQMRVLIKKYGSGDKLAKEIGCSPTTALNKLADHDINYKVISKGEIEIAAYIESILQDVEISKQNRKHIGKKEIDIYLPDLKIGFEHNGVYWHRENNDSHRQKYRLAKKAGIRLIQIFEDDWILKQDLVKRKIASILNVQDERVYARKCEIVDDLKTYDIRKFYDVNHIYGFKSCNLHVALKHENAIVAMMSFRKNKLERYATSVNVVGGFSKLLTHIQNIKKFETIETFADLCWSDEDQNVYTKHGFVKESITQPNYYWVVNGKKERRQKYMKGNLKKFDNYSDEKSETQIMTEKGYWKIYDAGHAKFVKHYPT